jgi:hypothetical protein
LFSSVNENISCFSTSSIAKTPAEKNNYRRAVPI